MLTWIKTSQQACWDFTPCSDHTIHELRCLPAKSWVQFHWERQSCFKVVQVSRNGVSSLLLQHPTIVMHAIRAYTIFGEQVKKIYAVDGAEAESFVVTRAS